jgi:hypothetical protein
MPLLEEKGIRPFTIHDSFVCKESETKTIEEVFTKKLIELYGIAPSLHLDYIEKVEDDEDDEKTVFDDAFFAEMNSWDDDESNDY